MLEFLLALWWSGILAAGRHLVRRPLRPGWSWRYETVVTALKSTMRRTMCNSPEQMRRDWESMAMPSAAVRAVRRERVLAGAVPCEWFVPRRGAALRTLVYFHGGSYVYGSAKTHGDLVARLALACEARVLFVDYRLAPEHPFPAPVDDALAAYRWLLQTVQAGSIVLAGDSAGGGLAVSLLCAARDEGLPLPAAAALICPWVDLAAQGGSLESNSACDWAEPVHFDAWARWYLGEQSRRDPRASPVYADLHGLPPLLVQVGTAEMLLDQVTAFADRARAAGVQVSLETWPDMAHDWHILASMFEPSRRAIDSIGKFVRARIPAVGSGG